MLGTLTHLDQLEAESISIIREAVGELNKVGLLFSGGKDSAVLLHLTYKALWPANLYIPVIHVDTGHNFPEVIEFRDKTVKKYNANLIVASVEDAITKGKVKDQKGVSRNKIQAPVLVELIESEGFDALLGGARRDEEKARAKERVFSFRDAFSSWDPRNQRPEPWDIYNTLHHDGEHFRIFPLSNWTELDIYQYIKQEQIELPSIYFAHERDVYLDNDLLMPVNDWITKPDVTILRKTVRFRTVGDMTCTAAIESTAKNIDEVIAEVASSTVSERGATRADDKTSKWSMEERKKLGYF
jgi:sulfate adenylyltransferase subunit 2